MLYMILFIIFTPMPGEVPHPYELHRGETADLNKSHEKRSDRLERLKIKVGELFPGETEEVQALREKIIESFNVPQYGDFHNEGMFMDSHLDLILEQINKLRNKQVPSEIEPDISAAFERTISRGASVIEQYVFLHDISKMDCLTIQKGKEKIAVSWDEWKEMLRQNTDGTLVLQGDEDALKRFCETEGITGISYYHQGKEKGTSRKHGDEGVEAIKKLGYVANADMLEAIERHEVAYQFSQVNASTYEEYFLSLSEEARDFALTASFVDTMASLKSDGKPDLTNFLFLVRSRQKTKALILLLEKLLPEVDKKTLLDAYILLSAEDRASDQELRTLLSSTDPNRFDHPTLVKMFLDIRKNKDALSPEDTPRVFGEITEKARTIRYNLGTLREKLEPLLANTLLTHDEFDRLLDIAEREPKDIGKTFGSKMKVLRPILDAAKI